jgi:hypothetical protein
MLKKSSTAPTKSMSNVPGSAALPALLERGQQLGPVRVPASALDLGELGHELAAVYLVGDSLTLRIQTQPTRALAVGGDAVVGDETGQGRGHVQTLV